MECPQFRRFLISFFSLLLWTGLEKLIYASLPFLIERGVGISMLAILMI